MSSDPAESSDERESRFRLEISLAVGYNRRRAAKEGMLEGRVITLALLLGGIPLTIWVVYQVITRLVNG